MDELLKGKRQGSKVSKNLMSLWGQKTTMDLTIFCSRGQQVKCHTAIFALVSPLAKEVLAEGSNFGDEWIIHIHWCPKSVVEYLLMKVYCLSEIDDTVCDWKLLRQLLKALKIPRVCFTLAPKTNTPSKSGFSNNSDKKRKAEHTELKPSKTEKKSDERKSEKRKVMNEEKPTEESSKNPLLIQDSGDYVLQKCASSDCPKTLKILKKDLSISRSVSKSSRVCMECGKPFKCTECPEKFSVFAELLKHRKSEHSDVIFERIKSSNHKKKL